MARVVSPFASLLPDSRRPSGLRRRLERPPHPQQQLDAARARIKVEGWTTDTAESLYLRAHDLKGLGSTYEFPLITRIAGSLCKMIDDPATRLKAPMHILDGHIDAIRACVRDGIKDDKNPIGKMLAEELEGRVRQFLG